jgi:uncharacterized protein YdaU (DUF1376 family)
LNHYPRHVGDYIRDTVGLTMLEDGAYTRLLDQYYAREAPLPADKAIVYRMARAVSKPEKAAVDAVLAMFFVRGPDGWRQKRADLELQAQSERSETARQSAKRKWELQRAKAHANADANALRRQMPTQSEGICELDAKPMLASSQKPEANTGRPVEVPTVEVRPPGTHETSPPMLPGSLTATTWRDWRSHLANRGKSLTPQAERLQLAQLAGHADAEAVVQNAIRSGHLRLEPVGGWPDRKPGNAHEKRAATAAAMYGTTTNARPDEPNDITAESRRIA